MVRGIRDIDAIIIRRDADRGFELSLFFAFLTRGKKKEALVVKGLESAVPRIGDPDVLPCERERFRMRQLALAPFEHRVFLAELRDLAALRVAFNDSVGAGIGD